MKYISICIFLLAFLHSENLDSIIEKIKQAESEFDISALEDLMEQTKEKIEQKTDEDDSRYWFARACLGKCNVERFLRRQYPDTTGKNITRESTAAISAKGLEVIEPIMQKNSNWSEAYRVRGELYSHNITGFLSGMTNGPRALNDLEKAIEIDKNNPYAHIAKAKMYYYNPPIAGGDVDRSIKICKAAFKLGGKDTALTLLSRGYIKKGRHKRAIYHLRKAINLNEKNIEAQYFLEIAKKGE